MMTTVKQKMISFDNDDDDNDNDNDDDDDDNDNENENYSDDDDDDDSIGNDEKEIHSKGYQTLMGTTMMNTNKHIVSAPMPTYLVIN